MLIIDQTLYDAIVAHARRDDPDEACGIVAGPEGTDRAERFIPMTNAARSPTFHEYVGAEHKAVDDQMWENDEDYVILYHSHTSTEAYPSRTDISIASYPQAHYVVVSTRDAETVEFRSYRIVSGEVTEEEVRVEAADRPE